MQLIAIEIIEDESQTTRLGDILQIIQNKKERIKRFLYRFNSLKEHNLLDYYV